ncbi:uncharacterized protein EI90DRAFT_3086740, partial [Cantharellus anzutake]|uniref:uncharacterized protein n=1 Tax=Cantharellus anzutake TaxID=1750568 RepID=UPI001907B169
TTALGSSVASAYWVIVPCYGVSTRFRTGSGQSIRVYCPHIFRPSRCIYQLMSIISSMNGHRPFPCIQLPVHADQSSIIRLLVLPA